MYYPYLRGRQFELLALRDFAESLQGSASQVFPIIEPVRENKNSLKKAAATLTAAGIPYGIIINPEYGECKDKWLDFSLEQDFPDQSAWSPVFIVKNNIAKIHEEIAEKQYRNVILILLKSTADAEEDIITLIHNNSVSKVVTDTPRRRVRHVVADEQKEIITLSDNFEAKSANDDYSKIDEELFSEEFAYFKEENYNGFADYTVVPNEFKEGGVLPKVVAIHLTYQKEEDQIYVKHFCSHSNKDNNSNIQGKFAEAAQKAKEFFDEHQHENSVAIDMLRNYLANTSFPGLGMIKKISILHHLLLIQRILIP